MRPTFGEPVDKIDYRTAQDRQLCFPRLDGNAAIDKTKHVLTDVELRWLKKLSGCIFQVGSWDKRFVRDMQGALQMTNAQRVALHRLIYRYRRQLGMTVEQARQVVDLLRVQVQGQG